MPDTLTVQPIELDVYHDTLIVPPGGVIRIDRRNGDWILLTAKGVLVAQGRTTILDRIAGRWSLVAVLVLAAAIALSMWVGR